VKHVNQHNQQRQAQRVCRTVIFGTESKRGITISSQENKIKNQTNEINKYDSKFKNINKYLADTLTPSGWYFSVNVLKTAGIALHCIVIT